MGIPEGGVGGEERKHTRGGPLGILEGGVDRQERRHTGGGHWEYRRVAWII